MELLEHQLASDVEPRCVPLVAGLDEDFGFVGEKNFVAILAEAGERNPGILCDEVEDLIGGGLVFHVEVRPWGLDAHDRKDARADVEWEIHALREAVEKDLAHPSPGWGASELFVQLGLYSQQISRWRAHFPDAQIKIMLTEDLRAPDKWQGLLDWLNLTQAATQHNKRDANTGGLARFEKLNRFLTLHGLKHKLGNLIPSGLKKKLVAWYYNSEALPKMTSEEREYVTVIYAEEIATLQSELKLEVGHWK